MLHCKEMLDNKTLHPLSKKKKPYTHPSTQPPKQPNLFSNSNNLHKPHTYRHIIHRNIFFSVTKLNNLLKHSFTTSPPSHDSCQDYVSLPFCYFLIIIIQKPAPLTHLITYHRYYKYPSTKSDLCYSPNHFSL